VRSVRVAVVVAVALVVVVAAPAEAATLGVASEHTSASEFRDGSIQGWTATGTGQSASLTTDRTDTADLGSPTNQFSGVSDRRGVEITLATDATEVSVELTSGTTATEVYVTDNAGTILGQSSVSSGSATISGLSLTQNESYFIVADDAGGSYTTGKLSKSPTVTSTLFNVSAGVYSGTQTSPNNFYNFRRVDISTGGSVYTSTTHQVSDAQKGFVNVTSISGSLSIEWQADSGSGWSTVASTTVQSTGEFRSDLSATSASEFRVVLDAGQDDATVASEGVLIEVAAPSGENPSPTGDVSNFGGSVSLDVSDPDFGTAQGDSLNVSVSRSGSTLNSTTITSNKTVSLPITALAGSNDLTWTLSDSYGTTTTVSHTFSTPANLELRNETAPRNLINSPNANATVTFFADNAVVSRDASNGKVDLSGLPAGERFVAVVDADGYYTRRIVIPSLFDQQTAYLLPTAANEATIVFSLDDRTGRFAAQTTRLRIERAIEVNGTTDYRVVSADRFGASGEFAATLADETRYRLTVINTDGDQRTLGAYTTAGDAATTLPIGEIGVGSTLDSGSVIQASLDRDASGQRIVRVTYRDPGDETSEINYEVVVNGSVVATVNETGTFGSYESGIAVNNSTQSAEVRYDVVRSGATLSGTEQLGALPAVTASWPIDSQVLSLLGWVTIFALTGLVVIWDARLSTLVGVGSASILTAIGVVGIPAMALGLAGVLAVLVNVGRDGGGP